MKEGEKFQFPGGGTMFPDGVGKYVDLMQSLIPGMKDGTIRTAIDTGCGVSSLLLLFYAIVISSHVAKRWRTPLNNIIIKFYFRLLL